MLKTIEASIILLVLLLAAVCAQEGIPKNEKSAVIVPPEVYLSVIVSQPDSPLKIENVCLLEYLDARYGKYYHLRNVGNKSIKSYTIAIWNSDNTGDIISWHINADEELIMPNQSIPSVEKCSATRIVPLSNELRNKLGLNSPIKKVLFFMVLEVEYFDGAKYDAKPAFDALKKHLMNFETAYEKLKAN